MVDDRENLDSEDKKEDSFEFDSAGEAVEYISMDRARVVAMRVAREEPGHFTRGRALVPVPGGPGVARRTDGGVPWALRRVGVRAAEGAPTPVGRWGSGYLIARMDGVIHE